MAKKGKLSRRSFLTRVAGGTIAAGAIGTVAGATMMQRYTDADPVDGVGRTGITDADPSDAANHGHSRTGITDSDSGACADAGGYGRGNTGWTDSDSSGCADPGGRGRGPSR
jgi:hypothetical protein|tara:strand:+ start:32637 stop:32972 length:336 start_codon:yes stop_codon:yes gene_type:complete